MKELRKSLMTSRNAVCAANERAVLVCAALSGLHCGCIAEAPRPIRCLQNPTHPIKSRTSRTSERVVKVVGVTKLWGVEHKRLVLQRAQMWNQISYTGIISLSPRSYNVNKSDVEFHLKIVTQIMIPHWTMHINFCAIYTLKCFGQAGHFASPVYVIVSGAEDKPHTLLCRAARAQRPSCTVWKCE